MFPLYKNIRKLNKIKNDFVNLKNYPLNLIDIELANKIVPNYKFEKIDNNYVIILDNYEESQKMNHITNYFSEICRIKCKKYNKDKSPVDIFKEIHTDMRKISKNKKGHGNPDILHTRDFTLIDNISFFSDFDNFLQNEMMVRKNNAQLSVLSVLSMAK